jgi:hypothetical protein
MRWKRAKAACWAAVPRGIWASVKSISVSGTITAS